MYENPLHSCVIMPASCLIQEKLGKVRLTVHSKCTQDEEGTPSTLTETGGIRQVREIVSMRSGRVEKQNYLPTRRNLCLVVYRAR